MTTANTSPGRIDALEEIEALVAHEGRWAGPRASAGRRSTWPHGCARWAATSRSSRPSCAPTTR